MAVMQELGQLLGFFPRYATVLSYSRFLIGLAKKVLQIRFKDIKCSWSWSETTVFTPAVQQRGEVDALFVEWNKGGGGGEGGIKVFFLHPYSILPITKKQHQHILLLDSVGLVFYTVPLPISQGHVGPINNLSKIGGQSEKSSTKTVSVYLLHQSLQNSYNVLLRSRSRRDHRIRETIVHLVGEMWPFNRKGVSGFNWYSTAEEVTEGIDGTGLTAIVTGASSGIGTETARVLALRHVHVIMAVRDVTAGNHVKELILKETPSAKVDVLQLDLSSFASVRKFVEEFDGLNYPLNILINNAGIMAPPFSLSDDGYEMQFAINYLGHFLLTDLLLENMKKTCLDSKIEGKIVNVSSLAHQLFPTREGINFDKINDKSSYSAMYAYGQSKLANILHANELTRRLKEEGVNITANSLHPGTIRTNLVRNHKLINVWVKTAGRLVMKDTHQGAATTCYVALNPQVKGISGRYFSDSNLYEPIPKSGDVELAKKLWEFSMKAVH